MNAGSRKTRPSCSVYSGVGVTASSVYCFDRDLNLFVQPFACFITSNNEVNRFV